MESDRLKWDKKFRDRPDKPNEPEGFLLRHYSKFKAGPLLDLPCGDGRNALFLADKGFQVTGIDISEVGLARLKKFATQKGLTIQTIQMDLEEENLSASILGIYDTIVINHFKPFGKLLTSLPDLLAQDGIFLCCLFNLKQHKATGFSKAYCVEEGELKNIHPTLKLIEYQSFQEHGKFLDGYLFQKV